MPTFSFDVSGMTCGGCTASVQRALTKLDGVSQVGVTLTPGVVTVVADLGQVTPSQIGAAITKLGFPAKLRHDGQGEKVLP